MRHEKTIKREDGSRVRISVELSNPSYEDARITSYVCTCKKGKRTWTLTYNSDDYKYRALSMPERRKYEEQSQLAAVSSAELLETKIELWQKLKPVS